MIDAIVKELEGLKAKVEEALQHAKSGVNTLNEDQQAVLKEMVVEIEKHAQNVTDKVHELIDEAQVKTESVVERIEDEVKTGLAKVEGFAGEVVQKAESLLGHEMTAPELVSAATGETLPEPPAEETK